MKLHILGAALLAACAAAFAQTQSGTAIGSNTGSTGSAATRPLPAPMPSTGSGADFAGARGTSPRAPDTSVGASGTEGTPTTGRTSGLCDTLIGEERAKCLREQASTGTVGPGSTR